MIDWLERLMLPCMIRMVTGLACPGCGFQRSVFLLLRGDLAASASMYWATIPILLMLILCLLHLKFRFTYGLSILIFLYSLNGILIICQYIYALSQQL